MFNFLLFIILIIHYTMEPIIDKNNNHKSIKINTMFIKLLQNKKNIETLFNWEKNILPKNNIIINILYSKYLENNIIVKEVTNSTSSNCFKDTFLFIKQITDTSNIKHPKILFNIIEDSINFTNKIIHNIEIHYDNAYKYDNKLFNQLLVLKKHNLKRYLENLTTINNIRLFINSIFFIEGK